MSAANITIGFVDIGGLNTTITLEDVNAWYLFQIKYTISAGCQFGALFVMFFVTWIMTSAQKRQTPVFILNMLSLGCAALKTLFSMIAEVGGYNQYYAWFSYDYQYITHGDQAVGILSIIFQWLMLIFINISLYLNAYTVCKTLDRKYRYIILAFSGLLFFGMICWRFAHMVLNIQATLGTNPWLLDFHNNYWFIRVGLTFETCCIWWFCFIFSGKLYLTQRERRKVGMKIWPATQLLSSIAGATMIVPAIFAIFEWTLRLQFPAAYSLTLTIVALQLPLSSLWAAKIMRDGAEDFTSKRLWGGSTAYEERYGSVSGKASWKTASTRDTDPRSNNSERRPSANAMNEVVSDMVDATVTSAPRRDSTEVDLEKMGVRIDRSYSVHSGQ